MLKVTEQTRNVKINCVQKSPKIFAISEYELEKCEKIHLPAQSENRINKKVNGTTYQIFFKRCQSYFFLF